MIEALLAVPGTLHALRELLAAKKPDSKTGLAKLEAMRASLVTFSTVGAWLDEARQLHQSLRDVDIALAPSVESFARATGDGYFESFNYDLGKARRCWETAKPHSLNGLIETLGWTRFVKDTSLIATETGTLRIPRWGVQVRELRTQIDAAFLAIDRNPDPPPPPPAQIFAAATSLKALYDHIKTQMLLADQEVRDRVSRISKALSTLEQDLKNG
jgi:hypothetical protein